MEFLVHNISHSDLIVELSWVRDYDGGSASDDERVPQSLLGRPKFSLFQQTGHAILEALTAVDVSGARLSSAYEGGGSAPVGFQLTASPIAVSSLHDFQIRGLFLSWSPLFVSSELITHISDMVGQEAARRSS